MKETMGPTSLPAWTRMALPLLVVSVLPAPFLLEGFTIYQLTMVGIYALAILGLNLLTGFNGQLSLGHSAFFALGAYTAAILVTRYHFSPYATIPIAGFLCFMAGYSFGLPALRLEGLYLAMATFALAIATPQLLKSSHLEGLTGGVQGIGLTRPEPPFGFPLDADQWWYFVTLAVLLFLFWVAHNLVRSGTGRVWIAIRDNPIAARASGIDTARYKTLAFGISAFYTGTAGALSAIVVEYVAPDSFTFSLSILFLIGMVTGGPASIPGAIFGGMFVLFVPNISEQISKGLSGAVYGIIIILVIFTMPSGAAGLARKLVHRRKGF